MNSEYVSYLCCYILLSHRANKPAAAFLVFMIIVLAVVDSYIMLVTALYYHLKQAHK